MFFTSIFFLLLIQSSSCEVLILDYETLELCQHSITPLGCFTAGVWTEYALKLPLKGTEHVIGHCILSTGAQLLATSIGRVVKLSSSFLPASIAFDGPKKPSLFACGSPRNFRLAQFARLTQSSAVIIFDEGALVLLTEPESNKAMPISGVSGDLSGEISGSGENQIFCTSDTTVRIYEVSRTRLTEIATFQSQNSETVRGFLNDRKFVLESATGWKLVDSDGQPIATGEKKPCCGGDISVSISAQVVFENNSQKIQLGVVRTGSGNLNFEISDHSVMCPEGTYPREIPVWPKFPIERWLGDLKLRQLLPIAMPSRGDWRANLREAYGEISDRVISFCLSSQAPRHLLEPNVLWALACRSQREVDVALAVAADFNPGVITAEARERLLSLDAVEDRLRDVIDRNSQANAITAQSLLAFLISKAQTSNLSFAYLPYPRDHGFRSAPMSFEDVMGYHDKVVPQDIPQHVPVESEIGNRDSSADVGQITAAPQTELGETNKALSLDFAAGPLPGERAEDAFESVELHPSVITVEYPTGDLGQGESRASCVGNSWTRWRKSGGSDGQ
ncbi:hypothetical protein C9890_0271 [Perkinsus sp. BL_2016]|nr:hypothetical protein C9890_0271 [Perkinsus sp. BL_2016]